MIGKSWIRFYMEGDNREVLAVGPWVRVKWDGETMSNMDESFRYVIGPYKKDKRYRRVVGGLYISKRASSQIAFNHIGNSGVLPKDHYVAVRYEPSSPEFYLCRTMPA